MDGAGSYSVAHRAGLLPTELTGVWGWILLRSAHQGRGSPPAPAPTKQRPALEATLAYVPKEGVYRPHPVTSAAPCYPVRHRRWWSGFLGLCRPLRYQGHGGRGSASVPPHPPNRGTCAVLRLGHCSGVFWVCLASFQLQPGPASRALWPCGPPAGLDDTPTAVLCVVRCRTVRARGQSFA